jgi:hypothetical protein
MSSVPSEAYEHLEGTRIRLGGAAVFVSLWAFEQLFGGRFVLARCAVAPVLKIAHYPNL